MLAASSSDVMIICARPGAPEQVAGSNGAMAGLVPLAAGHLALSWKQCALPWLQLAALLAAVCTHITISILQVSVCPAGCFARCIIT